MPNVKKVVYRLEGHITTAIDAKATMDADVASQLAALNTAFTTFVATTSALTGVSASLTTCPSKGGDHVDICTQLTAF